MKGVQSIDDFWGINGVIPVDKKYYFMPCFYLVMIFLHVVVNDVYLLIIIWCAWFLCFKDVVGGWWCSAGVMNIIQRLGIRIVDPIKTWTPRYRASIGALGCPSSPSHLLRTGW
jgi:hypothetical protein